MPGSSEAVPVRPVPVFAGCLVDGDPQQHAQELHTRRRSLTISLAVQLLALAAIVVIPLLGTPVWTAMKVVTPMPPYGPSVRPHAGRSRPTPPEPKATQIFLPPANPSPRRPSGNESVNDGSPQFDGPSAPISDDATPGVCAGSGCIPVAGLRTAPPPPLQSTPPRGPLHVTHLDPALLIHRVEPRYPALMIQLRRDGRVELHAIIARDGSIQSLEAVSGDPLFYQSALDAVSQWRYKPTTLNGEPVEIDTYISVIYSLNRR